MAETIKVLAQADLAATTLTDVFTVPAANNAVISTVTLCNRNAVSVAVRLSVAVAGAADNNKQYLYYDLPIGGNDTFAFTFGVTLDVGDVIRAFASTTGVSVNVFGVEIS